MCWTHQNALYISISVVLAHYIKIKTFIENCCQNDAQNALKSSLGDTLGLILSRSGTGNRRMETGIGKMDAGGEKMGHRNVENGAPVRGPRIWIHQCTVTGRIAREARKRRSSNILIDIYIYII